MFHHTSPGCLLIALVFLFGLPQVLPAQNYVLQGTVRDQDENPLEAVTVTIPDLHKGTLTGKDGAFRIGQIPPGTFTVAFSRIGYAGARQEVAFAGKAQQVELNVQLRQSNLQLETVTITGTPNVSDPLTSPQEVDAISGARKLEVQQTSLGETVKGIAGVSSINTGSQTGKPVIRGLSGNRIRVLTDGFPMDFQQYGVRHMPPIDPLMFERLEVVQGPSSILYGSDAMGGAINAIPRRIPEANLETPFAFGEAYTEFNTNNNEWATGAVFESAAGPWGLTGGIVKRSAGNMQVPDVPTADEVENPAAPKFTDELDHTDFDQLNAMAGLGYTKDFGHIHAHYLRWENEHNFLLPNGAGLGQRIINNTLDLKGVFPLSDGFILKPSFAFNSNRRQSNAGGDTRDQLPGDGNAHLDLKVQSATGRLIGKHNLLDILRGQIGLEYQFLDQTTQGVNEPLAPSAEIWNFSAFFFENLRLNNWTFSFGLRYDYRDQASSPNEQLNLPDFENGETEDVLTQNYSVLSGNFGLNYRFNEHLAASASFARGFRAPSIFNLHADGVHGGIAAFQIGAPDLDPEFSLNTDLSLKWRSDRVSVTLTGYRNAINDYIFLVNTGAFSEAGPPILRTVQGDAELIGGHMSAKAQLLDWLQVRGAYQLVRGENEDEDLTQVDDLPLLPADRITGQLRLTGKQIGPFNRPHFRLGIEHARNKEAAGRYEPFWQFGQEELFPFGVASTDAYTLMDLGLGFNLPFYDRSLYVDLSVQNLLNEDYRDFLNTYKGYALNPGRNVKMKVSVPIGNKE